MFDNTDNFATLKSLADDLSWAPLVHVLWCHVIIHLRGKLFELFCPFSFDIFTLVPTSRRVSILIHSVSFVSRLKTAKNMSLSIIKKLASVNDNFAGSFVSMIGKKLH